MGRRTSSGRIGAPTFGGLLADAQTITSDDNKDIIFDPTGTGIVKSEAHFQIQNQSSLRFGDADDSHYVGFQAPTAIGSDFTWTLPGSDGSANQSLVTDGTGNLSFASTGAVIQDNNTDSANHYVVLSQNTSGSLLAARISSTQLSFQPSTGNLSVNSLSVTSNTTSSSTSTGALVVTGGLGVGGTVTADEFTETSSAAFKSDITPITGALDIINKLEGVTYRKHDKNIIEPGLIAEEVEKYLPSVVSKDQDGLVYGINYTKIIAYLVESVKSLTEELNEIKRSRRFANDSLN